MNTYRSPNYPALMIRIPDTGRNIKATGGVFTVADEDVEAFEKVIAARPHYKIELIKAEVPEEGTAESLEALTVPVLRERLEVRGLPTEGRKAVLVERLAAAVAADGDDDEESGTLQTTAADVNETVKPERVSESEKRPEAVAGAGAAEND